MTKAKPADLIGQNADLMASGLQMQAQALELLLAEMRTLGGVLAAAGPQDRPTSDGGADPDTEAGFDNMPV